MAPTESAGLNGSPRSSIPEQYQSKEIKGVYMYVNNTLQREGNRWEDVAREFVQEQTGLHVEGRGSIKISCQIIQNNWVKFKAWLNSKYLQTTDQCY